MAFAFVFPGQGSQSVGMLAQLAGAEPLVQETFAEASDVLGYDLWKLSQSGPEEQLGTTEHTQPAILAAGVATWRVWRRHGGGLPVAMAGHSLGEYSALVCSGALDFRTAVALVRFRGQAMQAAVPAGQGAMGAILGLEVVLNTSHKQFVGRTSLAYDSSQRYQFEYQTPNLMDSFGTYQRYRLLMQKQAGARMEEANMQIILPENAVLISSSPVPDANFSLDQTILDYRIELDGDYWIGEIIYQQ